MVLFQKLHIFIETTGHNMKEKEKQQVLITQKGKTLKDYLVLKEQEYYREKSLERQINKYYKIKE